MFVKFPSDLPFEISNLQSRECLLCLAKPTVISEFMMAPKTELEVVLLWFYCGRRMLKPNIHSAESESSNNYNKSAGIFHFMTLSAVRLRLIFSQHGFPLK